MVAVRVIPRAGRTGVAGLRGGAILVRLSAPPIAGAANAALLAFLADRLGVPARALAIARGDTSRDKLIRIDGLAADEARARLLEA
jgi:uncharacterized protein (TIGR00251 family)